MLDGLDDLNSLAVDLAAAGWRVTRAASDVLDKSAHDIEATAKGLVPVDTGATKNSIGVDRPVGPELVAVVGPTTEYAPHLEFGTVHMAPHAFMGPALDVHAPAFVEALETIAGDVL
jgi:HK97 gp10 family phage protein